MMGNWLRDGFYTGLGIALCIGLFLVWLWQPQRQVNRHTENLLRKLEKKNWAAVANSIGGEYTDKWGDDRSLVVARMQQVFRYLRGVTIHAADPTVSVDQRRGIWRARIVIGGGDADEATAMVKERINSLSTPFELTWRRMSGKPWDWKLVYVSNPELEISPGFD
jgi:hypothetical protein